MSRGRRTIVGDITISYLKCFPDMPDLTLSKLIHKENPLHYKSIESARDNVRLYRGHRGKSKKNTLEIKEFVTPVTYNTTPFKSPPSQAEKLQIFTLPKDRKSILLLCDLHIPYHHEQALEISINYGLEHKCDTIWLNGDIIDMYQASTHEKNPSNASIKEEFDMARDFIKQLRNLFPNAAIYWKEGNHCARFERLLMRCAPQIFGNSEFELKNILRLEEYKVHWIPNSTLAKFGKLNVIHGNEFKGGAGVNPARSLFLRAKNNTITGDKHKTGENTEGSLNGEIITTWSVGCLCDLNPRYMPFGHVNWNAGFAHITMNGDDFHVKNYRIFSGKIL